ncbi:gas vesicle protein [Planosporangium thailandense]|uniref:Gas vesicle protein n=1 Tax=Planosporangium thailandense TaxID=765197 RepID=A0ABX0XQW3_9ACTN|nr:gas vesicle protein GvpO [Planosporangium thailandense]NJC68323.1 gas vesicle protein [Planosporangium thailandense]
MAPPRHDERKNDQKGQSTRALTLAQVARTAMGDFVELTGLDPVAMTGARPDGDGWSLLVDVTELARIPATSSVMATYRVDVDSSGHVISYERLRRFSRNATDLT